MNRFNASSTPAVPTSVHVEIRGAIDIPLNLGLLSELGDAMMEQEIIKEAVRIAVSERLGYFDGVEVRLSSSGGREGAPAKPNGTQHQQQLVDSPTAAAAAAATTRSYNQRYCEADLNLNRLGSCIESIQKTYEDLLVQMHVVQDVLSGTGPFSGTNPASPTSVSSQSQSLQQQQQQTPAQTPAQTPTHAPSTSTSSVSLACPDASLFSNVPVTQVESMQATEQSCSSPSFAEVMNRLRTAQHVVETALRGRRPDIVREAAAMQEAEQMSREEAMLEQEHALACLEVDELQMSAHRDHEAGVDAELRRGLLADEDDDEEETRERDNNAAERNNDNTNNDDSHDEDDLDEEAMHERYLRAGYSPL